MKVIDVDKKVWMITGCSSGIGYGIAKAALSAGDYVMMTARKTDLLSQLSSLYPKQAVAMKLDVTDTVEMDNVVEETLNHFSRIDVLVNNAGYGYRAAIEESEDDEIQKLFDVNVFAPVRLIKRVLPAMRKQKHGLVINITSIGGIRVAGGNGMYSAAKGAMELAADTLYKECEPLGIKVMMVEPGAFRTAFYDNLRGTAENIGDYASTAGKWHIENMKNMRNQPGDPEKAGEVLVRLAEMANPPKHFAMGSDAVKIIEAEYTARLAELKEWSEFSSQTDF